MDALFGFKIQKPQEAVKISSLDDGLPKSHKLFGIDIVESEFATRTVFVVKALPIKKRRKGYRVVREQRPCVFMSSDPATMAQIAFVHPVLMPELRKAARLDL